LPPGIGNLHQEKKMRRTPYTLIAIIALIFTLNLGCGAEEEVDNDNDQDPEQAACSLETQEEDCREGEVCDEEQGECIEGQACTVETEDQDCRSVRKYCDEELGRCVEDPDAPECSPLTESIDCEEGEFCHGEWEECIEVGG
jgi:hypothetical protein